MPTRDDLTSRFAPKVEAVEHDGETYYLRRLTVADKLSLWQHKDEPFDMQGVYFVLTSLADETGKRLLTYDDAETVNNMPFDLFSKLLEASNMLNGITPQAYEEIKKNSTAPNLDLPSD